MKIISSIITFSLFIFLLIGCSLNSKTSSRLVQTRQKVETNPTSTLANSNTLGPGDIFELRIYNEKDLSGIHRIASDGTVDIPLIGRINLNTLTSYQASDLIISKLNHFLKSPQVSIFIKEQTSKKVYVFGQVKRPGTFTFVDDMNIVHAITLAGGFNALANQNSAYVNRSTPTNEQRIEVAVKDIGKGKTNNFLLKPGDIIYIPESLF